MSNTKYPLSLPKENKKYKILKINSISNTTKHILSLGISQGKEIVVFKISANSIIAKLEDSI